MLNITGGGRRLGRCISFFGIFGQAHVTVLLGDLLGWGGRRGRGGGLTNSLAKRLGATLVALHRDELAHAVDKVILAALLGLAL